MNETIMNEVKNILNGERIECHKNTDELLLETLNYLTSIGIVKFDEIRFAYTINPDNPDSTKHLQKFLNLKNLDKFKKYYNNYNPNKKSFLEKFESYLNITNSIYTLISISSLYALYKYFKEVLIFIQKLF